MTRVIALILAVFALAAPASAKGLEIYFIDVEGGQATLIVTPDGQSMLIDAGYGRPGQPDRIMRAARDAGITHIDYLLVTHFHGDHVGGIPELSTRIPIMTFVDYGGPLGTIYGADRMTVRSFTTYETVRANAGRHITPGAGDKLPMGAVDITVASSGGELLTEPLPGGGEVNDACSDIEHHPEDGTENFRSLGIVLRYGAFSFVNLGDLSGDTLSKIICPRNLLGKASVYLIAHHGDYDTDSRAMYAALRPRVAVMNNGVTKGGDPATFRTVHSFADTDLWQLHASRNPGAQNSPDELIANLDDVEDLGHWIKLVANEDGSFSVTNGRTGMTRSYARTPVNGQR